LQKNIKKWLGQYYAFVAIFCCVGATEAASHQQTATEGNMVSEILQNIAT